MSFILANRPMSLVSNVRFWVFSMIPLTTSVDPLIKANSFSFFFFLEWPLDAHSYSIFSETLLSNVGSVLLHFLKVEPM